MKKYDVYVSGGEKITEIYSACISKACKSFVETLEKSAKYALKSKEYATIRYDDNHSVCNDFLIMEH